MHRKVVSAAVLRKFVSSECEYGEDVVGVSNAEAGIGPTPMITGRLYVFLGSGGFEETDIVSRVLPSASRCELVGTLAVYVKNCCGKKGARGRETRETK